MYKRQPLASLDLKRKGEILPYLERLHEELDIPVLYVSHSPDEVARLADHLVLLENGKVRASGPIGETLARVDLPLALDDDAGVVIEGTVSDHDPAYGLLKMCIRDRLLAIAQFAAQTQRQARMPLDQRAHEGFAAALDQSHGVALG